MIERYDLYQPTRGHLDALTQILGASSGPMSRAEIGEKMGAAVHTATLCRWLDTAQKQGLVERAGKGSRSTAYQLTDSCRAQLVADQMARPVTRRPKVGYVREFLQEYIPNESTYLGRQRLEMLHRKCPVGSAPTAGMEERRLKAFMADLAYSSSKLEGNTYSYKAMLKLVDEGVEASGHDPEEAAMLLNHYDAAGFLAKHTRYPPREGDPSISKFEICSLHTMLSHSLLPDPRRCGQIRVSPVEIGESSYIPLAGGADLEYCFELAIGKAVKIADPYEQAFFLLVHLPYLQVFDDCNKRTARVACSIPLLRSGVLPMSWYDTSPKEFVSAILAVYEHNETYGMAEVFAEGYARSAERFALSYRTIAPALVTAVYRRQIKEVIGDVVSGGVLSVPESVKPVDAAEFVAHVDAQLAALRDNNALAVAYGLDFEEVQAWAAPAQTQYVERRG